MSAKNKSFGDYVAKEELSDLYLNKSMLVKDIALYFDYDRCTILKWIKIYEIKKRTRSMTNKIAKIVPPKQINAPCLEINPNLFYILGVLKGDGCVSKYVQKNGKCITYKLQLNVTDLSFAQSFLEALQKINLNSKIYNIYSKKGRLGKKHVYSVQAFSKIFYEWYQNVTFDWIEEQCLQNKNLALSFLRGMYESDGTEGLYTGYLRVRISGINARLIELCHQLISSLGYSFNKHAYLKRSKLYPPERNLITEFTTEKNGVEAVRFLRELNPIIKGDLYGR